MVIVTVLWPKLFVWGFVVCDRMQ